MDALSFRVLILQEFLVKFFALMLFALPFLAVRWIVIKVLDYFNK